MEAELVEPESSTGPKKSRFKRDEPPLAAETGAAEVNRYRERETCSGVSDQSRHTAAMLFGS